MAEKEIVLPYDPQILERGQRIWEFNRLSAEQKAAKVKELAQFDAVEAKLGLKPQVAAVVDPDWSFPASMAEWAMRFHKTKRTLARWRKEGKLRMKRYGKEWRVETHAPIYQKYEQEKLKSK